MKLLKLTQGKQTLLDDEDYEWAKEFKWYTRFDHHNYYVQRYVKGTLTIKIQLHREILGLKKGDGKFGDHINGNGLDNRRDNLRICNRAENQHNQRIQFCDKTSEYKGVCWDKRGKKFQARINLNGKTIFLGYFLSELKAARAYDEAAVKYFGEFARVNFKEKK